MRWFRRYLGQDEDAPVRHPLIVSGLETRTLGVKLRQGTGDTAATLIPSVGCPMGCNFCSTSAMFGGKGRFVDLYKTGDELFAVMRGLERALRVQSFFVMDENFLLHRKRALRLLELMRDRVGGAEMAPRQPAPRPPLGLALLAAMHRERDPQPASAGVGGARPVTAQK